MSKDKQIEEMARVMCGMASSCNKCMFNSETCYEYKDAEDIYNAGYRKQSEAEWTYGENNTMKCTLCRRRMPKIILARFCPNCGAKMKGV